ncbi:MAG TPA: AI-2E family transporter, partial [Planctomycetota bacterium]|nr:AI-2E family transporter [Planctomycetota bacterium]
MAPSHPPERRPPEDEPEHAVEPGPVEGPPPPTSRTRSAFAIAIAFAAVLVIYWMRSSVFLTFSGLLIGILVSYFADFLHEKLRFPRKAAVTGVTVVLFGLGAGLVALLAVPVVNEVTKLVDEIPQYQKQVEHKIDELKREHPALVQLLPQDFPSLGGGGGAGGAATKVVATGARTLFAGFEGLVELVTL